MHLLTTIGFSIAFFIFDGLKRAKQYHATMLYIVVSNLFYHVLCTDYMMWHYEINNKEFEFIIEMIYGFTVLPITAFLFLEYAPHPSQQSEFILHFFKWESIYFIMEWLMYQFGAIRYENNWNILWSGLFLMFMFPCIYLHHKKPTIAYIISVGFILFLIYIFNVPIFMPLEERGM